MRGAAIGLALCVLVPAAGWAQEPDNAVDARVRSSSQAAESYQGPLDGRWTLVSQSGQSILAFQLVDKPGGREPLEGVWRDLRRPVVPGDIGFVDSLVRSPGGLAITLNATPTSQGVTITLKSGPDGVWSGEMQEGGATTPVRMRRG